MNVIGKPRRRVDGRAKVTGQTRFADDLVLPRMLHCKLLRSPLPHARIVRIDVSRALAHPGVHLVLTGKDLPIPYGILPVSQDEHALAIDRVRFVGDPVAAVVARDELTAFEALDLIDVEYEPLRTFSDPDDSLTLRRAAHPRLRRRRQHPQARVARVRRRRRRRSPPPITSSRTCSSTRATRTCRSSSTPRVGGDAIRTASWCSGRARRRRTTCIARSPRCSRCRRRTSASSPRPTAAASAARAIRSTTRSSSPRPR